MEHSTHLLTPASLKALAHPIRAQLLGLLRLDGPSTATALGARLGESSGTTSYHLRQLAAAGFVAEDAGRGNGRERWWRAAQDSTRLETDQLDDDPATQQAVDSYLHAVTRATSARVQAWLEQARSWPRRWYAAATLSDYHLHLSAAELGRLNAELEAVVESYRRAPRRGDEQVVVQLQSFPVRSGS
jgi:DNA-binding transcriptional ArsR family regulator